MPSRPGWTALTERRWRTCDWVVIDLAHWLTCWDAKYRNTHAASDCADNTYGGRRFFHTRSADGELLRLLTFFTGDRWVMIRPFG